MKVLLRSELVLGIALVLALFAVGCDEIAPFDISTTNLSDGRVGTAYTEQINTIGGSSDVEIYVLDGQLPPGIAFRQHDDHAELYGTPVIDGQYLFTVEAVDHHGESGNDEYVSRGFVITVQP
jgi:hypothetical protein